MFLKIGMVLSNFRFRVIESEIWKQAKENSKARFMVEFRTNWRNNPNKLTGKCNDKFNNKIKGKVERKFEVALSWDTHVYRVALYQNMTKN